MIPLIPESVASGETFNVMGFTGLDVLWSVLLSEKHHVEKIAKRWVEQKWKGADFSTLQAFIRMPSGKCYRLLDAEGNVAESMAHHQV